MARVSKTWVHRPCSAVAEEVLYSRSSFRRPQPFVEDWRRQQFCVTRSACLSVLGANMEMGSAQTPKRARVGLELGNNNPYRFSIQPLNFAGWIWSNLEADRLGQSSQVRCKVESHWLGSEELVVGPLRVKCPHQRLSRSLFATPASQHPREIDAAFRPFGKKNSSTRTS